MVSVIMPVLNREKTIDIAINSVVQQIYQDWELIVVDDGSTDNTINLVEQWKKKEERIVLIRNEGTHGVSGARNAGINVAKGGYIAFLDSDDEWTKNHLDECLSAMEETGYNLCSALWIEEIYGQLNRIGENGWYQYIFDDMQEKLNINRSDKYWKFDKRLFEYIIMTDFYCFHINTVVVRKDLLIQVGKFDVKMKGSEDLDLVYRLLQVTPLVTVNNYHFIYHYGEDNLYAFIDRNNADINQIIENKENVRRMCTHLIYKIKLLRKMKRLLQKCETERDKRALLQRLCFYTYNCMMTYSYISRKMCRIKSIRMLIVASKYFGKCKNKEESLFHPFSSYRENHLYLD